MPKLDEAKERFGASFLGGRQIKTILREIKDLKK